MEFEAYSGKNVDISWNLSSIDVLEGFYDHCIKIDNKVVSEDVY